MAVEENLTSAAGQAAGLRNSVAALRERLSITVDVQRLRDDITRRGGLTPTTRAVDLAPER